MLEKRNSRCQARSMEARIGYDGKFRLRCLILNISPDGAKLSLKAAAELPAEFVLSTSNTEYWARTTWRKSNVLGVSFTEPPVGTIPAYGVRQGRNIG